MKQFLVTTSDAMEAFGSKLAKLLEPGDLLLLAGPLGAGKTTLTRGIGEGLRASGTIQSPTFVLARTHRTSKGPLVHVDAYRLGSAVELDDLDIDFERSIVVIEWARDYLEGYVENYLEIEIDRSAQDESRVLKLKPVGRRWEEADLASLD